MTANVTPATDMADSTGSNKQTDAQYRCPHCEATYADERLTRVHITRADDSAHRHHNGLMPEEEIEVLNADGAMIETRSRRPTKIELSNITVDAFPGELSDKRAHILVIATHHPDIDNRRQLTDMVRNRIENGGYDVSPPSAQTVRRALDAFYQPHDAGESVEADDETLADLTPTQQAILIGQLVLPKESNTGIADRIGCAKSYPGQLKGRKEQVVTRVENRIEDGDGLIPVLADELTGDTLVTLIDEGLLSAIPVDLQSIIAEMDLDETSAAKLSDILADSESDAESTRPSQWGSPADHAKGMHAAPPEPFGTSPEDSQDDHASEPDGSDADSPDLVSVSTAGSDSDDSPSETDDDLADSSDDEATGAPDDRSADAGIDRVDDDNGPSAAVLAEIATLQQKVAFFRQTLAPVSEADEQMRLLASFAEQIEQSCEMIVDASESA